MKQSARFTCILFLLTGCLFTITPDSASAHIVLAGNYFLQNQHNNSNPSDTIPKLVIKPGITKPVPQKARETNFMQKFLSAFSFKKNADVNERMRILALIDSDSMRLDTNLNITMQNIEILKNELELNNSLINDSLKKGISNLDSLKKNADSLLQKLKTLKKEEQWTHGLKNKLRILKYDVSKGLQNLKLQTGPDNSDKANTVLYAIKLKPPGYTESIKKNLIETNIFFFPRSATSETDSIFLKSPDRKFNPTETTSRYLYLFTYIIDHPCACCITKNDEANVQLISRKYMSELEIDSLVKNANIDRIKNNKAPFYSRFEYIGFILTGLLRNTALVILSILLLLTAFYYFKNSYQGTDWKGRRLIAVASVFIAYTFIIVFFSYLYSAGTLPYIGVKQYANPAYLLENIPLPTTANSHKGIQPDSYAHSPEYKCINVSLTGILFSTTIIFLILLLFVVPRFVRLLKRRTVP